METVWLGFGLGARQNGQSFMPRFRAANMQPSHTRVMQQTLNLDCLPSSGRGNWQIGQSSSSDLVRPFFIRTSCFPEATHSSHRRMLCLSLLCSSLNEPSGSSRTHAPQIFMMEVDCFPSTLVVCRCVYCYFARIINAMAGASKGSQTSRCVVDGGLATTSELAYMCLLGDVPSNTSVSLIFCTPTSSAYLPYPSKSVRSVEKAVTRQIF
mmetsp:Transcript_22736/g.52203  ORF Transcript_22736/g.52203 Transcript_22736/m.52203 type:complete len:210 (+) Transcript_22736:764-1393(+)